MSLEFLFALQDGRHVLGENGDRIRQLPGGGTSLRPGNKELRDVPDAEARLWIRCHAPELRFPYLIAVLGPEGLLTHDASAQEDDGSIRTPCRCQARVHWLDLDRVVNVAEVREGMPPKKRRADIRSVLRETRG